MKQLLLLIATLALSVAQTFAAQMCPATGRVVDQQGQAVEFATVVLLKGSQQVVGIVTDDQGHFTLKAPAGDYTLSVQYLGCDPVKKPVTIDADNDLGSITLKNSANQIEGVVVTGQLIRREADRFVVDVANAPSAIGKDGVELLEHAPGIWIDGEKISINGKSGSKVYVNERELRMDPAQLLTYLRSMRAEEIQKIEVVPVTGADYDADSAGGVIKITLRKRRENGMDGSLSMRTNQSGITHNYMPSGNINIHSGRLDLYASAWGSFGSDKNISDEHTTYFTQDALLQSHSERKDTGSGYGGSLGGVYELSDKHSIGAEFEYWSNDTKGPINSYTDFTSVGLLTRTDSRYDSRNQFNNYSATFNYIYKLDTLGSTLKVLADYTRRGSDSRNDNDSRISGTMPRDSVYRDISSSLYNVATASLALDKNFSPRWSLRTGVKYTYNDMHNDALYEYLQNEQWKRNDNQSLTINYSEHIAAAYGIVSAKLGRWSLVGGLRGEMTHTYGKGGAVGQNYFSLFPNANLSYALSKDGAYSIIAQYARTIGRPRFWSLNPQRIQISDYTYQQGDPNLNPAFKQDVSVTLVLKHKYTLTGGVTIQKDEINQTMLPDPEDPDRLCIKWVNFDRTTNYYFTANLPFQLTKWWTANAKLTYMRRGQRMDQHAAAEYSNAWFLNTSTTFTLPAKFFIDLAYNYQGQFQLGSIIIEPENRLHATIKKRFGDNFTASFTVRNLLDEPQRVTASGEGFTRWVEMRQQWNNRTFQIGLTYNFKSGKAFKRKTVEAGSADEKSRL